jgi:DNA polymerase-3 subunit gamma/tau
MIPPDYPALVRFLEGAGKHQLAVQLHDQVGLVRYAPPELALKPLRPFGGEWPRELALLLKSLTGMVWQVVLSDEAGEPSLLDQEKIAGERVRAAVLDDDNVRSVLDAFPGAELETFSTKGQ